TLESRDYLKPLTVIVPPYSPQDRPHLEVRFEAIQKRLSSNRTRRMSAKTDYACTNSLVTGQNSAGQVKRLRPFELAVFRRQADSKLRPNERGRRGICAPARWLNVPAETNAAKKGSRLKLTVVRRIWVG